MESCAYNHKRGFTLVELVLVVMVIGILSVTVIPRAFDNSEIAATIYQNRAISILRNMQNRAMQDTRNDGYCYQVNFDNDSNEFGIPSNDFSITTDVNVIAATCGNTINTTDPKQLFYVPSTALNSDGVDLQAVANDGGLLSSIQFDNLGRANQGDNTCSGSPCRIQFYGDTTRNVCIEAEGYIYACD